MTNRHLSLFCSGVSVSRCLEHWMRCACSWGTHLVGDVRVSEMHQDNQTKVRWCQGSDSCRDSGLCDNNEVFAYFDDGEVAVGTVHGVKHVPTHLSSIRTAFAGTGCQRCRELRQSSICVVCGTTTEMSKGLPKNRGLRPRPYRASSNGNTWTPLETMDRLEVGLGVHL